MEDKRATPAEIADFEDWLSSLSRRQRKFANLLATGESTTAAARRFDVSLGRISQIRRELEYSWRAFQGEATSTHAADSDR